MGYRELLKKIKKQIAYLKEIRVSDIHISVNTGVMIGLILSKAFEFDNIEFVDFKMFGYRVVVDKYQIHPILIIGFKNNIKRSWCII